MRKQRKGYAARTELCEHHCEQTLGYHTAREYPHKYIERACKVVADYAHKLARQVSAPRVHQAFAVAYYVMHIVKIENILCVKVKRQHRPFTERVYIERHIRYTHKYHRDKKCRKQITVSIAQMPERQHFFSERSHYFSSSHFCLCPDSSLTIYLGRCFISSYILLR